MAFIDASDETGKITFVAFSNAIKKLDELEENKVCIIKGKIVKRLDKYQINIVD